MSEIKDRIKEELDNLEKPLKPKERKMVEEALIQALEYGKAPYEAMGISKDLLESLYGQAYRLFDASKYDEALLWFKFLHHLDEKDPRFLIGIGGCFHMQKIFHKALLPYALAYNLDRDAAVPLCYMIDCYLNLGDKKDAATTIDYFQMTFGKNPLYHNASEKYRLMRKNLGPGFSYEALQEELKEAERIRDMPFKDLLKEFEQKYPDLKGKPPED